MTMQYNMITQGLNGIEYELSCQALQYNNPYHNDRVMPMMQQMSILFPRLWHRCLLAGLLTYIPLWQPSQPTFRTSGFLASVTSFR